MHYKIHALFEFNVLLTFYEKYLFVVKTEKYEKDKKTPILCKEGEHICM